MTVIGLTGGIASGKSTAAGWMKELGAIVIDADRLGHRVYEPGSPGFQAVVNEFGHDLVQADGTINRQLLGGRVFGDPEQMKRLTDIVWPEIRRLAKLEVTELKRRDKSATIVLEAAVLVEANWFDLVDEVWVVTVDPAIARTRLMTRNSLTEAQAQARIDSQISNKERSLHAYVKIDNSGTLDEFRQTVDKEWAKLAKRAGFTMPTRAPAAPAVAPRRGAAASKTAAKPAPKAAIVASKATAAKPAAKAAVKAPAAATKPAPAKPAPAKPATAKAAAAKASAPKAAPARATTRSASTQSASTRTSSARSVAPKAAASKSVASKPAATRAAASKATASRGAAPRATAAQAKATAAKVTAVKRTVAAKPAPVKAAAKPVARTAPKPAAKTAARPVAGRRAAAK